MIITRSAYWGTKRFRKNDNTAYNANQVYQLLTKRVYAFSHDFQVSRDVYSAGIRHQAAKCQNWREYQQCSLWAVWRCKNTYRKLTAGQTAGRTSAAAGNGPRSGAELKGYPDVPAAPETELHQGTMKTTGSRGRNYCSRQPFLTILLIAAEPAEGNAGRHRQQCF